MTQVVLGNGSTLLGRLTPAAASCGLGAVIWGTGFSEFRLARRLATLGVTSLQIRICGAAFDDDDQRNAIYDRDGIRLCTEAVDHLVQRFALRGCVLMGNCAAASLAFNAARADPRIAGVIMTNPHFEGLQKPVESFVRKLSRAEFWGRVARGQVDVADRLRSLGRALRAGPEGGAASGLAVRYRGDVYLDASFAEEIAAVASRGVAVYLACSRTDDSLLHVHRHFSKTLSDLARQGVTFHLIDRDVHVFEHDEIASDELNAGITAWVARTLLAAGHPPAPRMAAAQAFDAPSAVGVGPEM